MGLKGIIEIGEGGVLLAEVKGGLRRDRIMALTLHASPEDAARAARSMNLLTVHLVLSQGRSFFRSTMLPSMKPQQLQETLPFELESDLPLSLDEALVSRGHFEKEQDGFVESSAVVASAEEIKRLITVIEAEGVKVLSVDWAPALTARAVINRLQLKETCFLVDSIRRWMGCVVGDRLLEIHPLSSGELDLRREINIARLSLPESASVGPPRVILLGSREGAESAGHLAEVQHHDLFDLLLGEGGVFPVDLSSLANGTASLLFYDGRRFKKGIVPYRLMDIQAKRVSEALGRQYYVAAGLLVLLLIAFVASAWGIAHTREERRLKALSTEIKSTYEKAFPGETSVMPLEQAQKKAEELKSKNRVMEEALSREYSALTILKNASAVLPPDLQVKVVEFTSRPSELAMVLQVNDYSAAEAVVKALQDSQKFKNVSIGRQTSLGKGQIQVEINAESAGSEAGQ